jgi:ABC-type polysaccharide/polyol phosphate transport system ATPase subunit
MSFSWRPNVEHPEQSPMLLKHCNLSMDQSSRIGVLGVNGAGEINGRRGDHRRGV